MIRRLLSISGLVMLGGMMMACTTDSDESVAPATDTYNDGFVAKYIPTAALVPFPNDIFFSGTTDGTLNLPTTGTNPALAALNELDGYSLNAKIYADITDAVESATVVYGGTVFLIDTGTLAVVPATASTASFSGGEFVIEITPAAPLKPATTYAAFITKGIESATGDNLGTDDAFQALVDLHAAGTPAGTDLGDATTTALYSAVQPLLAAADVAMIGSANLAVAWSFKTQSIGASLAIIDATATAQTNAFVPMLRNPANPGDGIYTAGELLMPASDLDSDGTPDIGTNADVYLGMIEIPYYTTDPLTGHWVPEPAPCQAVVDAVAALTAQPVSTTSACPTPALQNTYKVPVLLTVPNNTGGVINGVVIFQHGITGSRTNMLPLAGAMANAAQALIAIDLPLHGITDDTSPLYAGNLQAIFADMVEQTFELDADSDGTVDSSGANFINLASLLTTRDSLRQASVNLINLVRSVDTMDYNVALDGGASGTDFDGLPISFVGMSLGAITGTTFLANNTDVNAAVLSVPGGKLSALLSESATFGPVINEGLAANGIVEGTRSYAEFLRNAQTAVDGGDPINYALTANANHPVLMHEVIGGGGSLPDQVVPNSATDALAAVMGLTQLGSANHAAAEVDGLVKFVAGSHSSLLDPSSSLNTTTEMQTQAANFVASGGTFVPVGQTHPEVIDAP